MRWRPSSGERRSPYITAEGFGRLKCEYDHLWRERRPEVVRALAAAAAEGDRSENAEYQYRKKELREIDRRVHYLQKRLPELKVADAPPADRSRVYFGARVEIVDEHGASRRLRIVGADEADPAGGSISIDSPLARALLQRCVSETVQLALTTGEREYEVLAIEYEVRGSSE